MSIQIVPQDHLETRMKEKQTEWTVFKKRSYVWVTLIFFLVSVTLHFLFGWEAYKREHISQGEPIIMNDYVMEAARDTFENWQSEFLQLIWQIAGLAFLFYVSSPSSREGDDRKEEKLDYLIKKLYGGEADKIISELEEKFPKK